MIQQVVDVLNGILCLFVEGEPCVVGPHVLEVGDVVLDCHLLVPGDHDDLGLCVLEFLVDLHDIFLLLVEDILDGLELRCHRFKF